MTPTDARLAALVAADPRPDGALLAAFLTARDEDAFAELVRRAGPLVWAACRRRLPDRTDAEDCFQATFLVLVRRGRRFPADAALGPWLYRVAALTAQNARRRNARRLARTARLPDAVAAPVPPAREPDLDAALLALPEKYRTPVILCHLQGWSRHDAAARLGCPEGTLSARLARALAKLRAKLGADTPSPVIVVPAALCTATLSAAAAERAAGGAVPAAVRELADGVVRALALPKAGLALAGLAVVFALGAGVGLSVRETPGAVAQVPTAPPPRPADKAEATTLDWQLHVDSIELSRARLPRVRTHEETAKSALDAKSTGHGLARLIADQLAADTPQDQRDRVEQDVRMARIRLAQAKAKADEATLARKQLEDTLRQMVADLEARYPPQVTATLAVDVTFPDTSRVRVVNAARALVEQSNFAQDGHPAAAWDAAARGAHVLIRFPRDRATVPVPGGGPLTVAEILVPLPLTRTPGGVVMARDGERIVAFAKYPHDACVRLQDTLSRAVPVGK